MLESLAIRYAELQEWAIARRLIKDCPPDKKIKVLATILVEWKKQYTWVARFSQDKAMGASLTENLTRIKEVRFK
ncbi:MAG: hypothetical protein ACFCBU_13560 [Cyanophyceae cyanobacterium]